MNYNDKVDLENRLAEIKNNISSYRIQIEKAKQDHSASEVTIREWKAELEQLLIECEEIRRELNA